VIHFSLKAMRKNIGQTSHFHMRFEIKTTEITSISSPLCFPVWPLMKLGLFHLAAVKLFPFLQVERL